MERLMTTEEFSEVTGMAIATVHKNNCLDRFPFQIIKMGNKLRFKRPDVENWIDSGCPYLPARTEPRA